MSPLCASAFCEAGAPRYWALSLHVSHRFACRMAQYQDHAMQRGDTVVDDYGGGGGIECANALQNTNRCLVFICGIRGDISHYSYRVSRRLLSHSPRAQEPTFGATLLVRQLHPARLRLPEHVRVVEHGRYCLPRHKMQFNSTRVHNACRCRVGHYQSVPAA